MRNTPQVTTAAFERSHGRKPRGFATWAFQGAAARTAFDAELVGEPTFITANYSEAREIAQRHIEATFVAVLP